MAPSEKVGGAEYPPPILRLCREDLPPPTADICIYLPIRIDLELHL